MNYAIRVREEESRTVQIAAFKVDYTWWGERGGTDVQYTDSPVLWLNPPGKIIDHDGLGGIQDAIDDGENFEIKTFDEILEILSSDLGIVDQENSWSLHGCFLSFKNQMDLS